MNKKIINENSGIIEFRNVSKWFDTPAGRFNALSAIDLTIQRGGRTAITGKSGSGKSTFLNMLSGIDHPSEGSVEIGGARIHELTESQLSRWRGANIGIVFQFFQLMPTLTILENLVLAMEFVNVIPGSERKTRAMDLLKQVGIEKHFEKYPSDLSGGEQQRAAIARALANDPPILVADEPTGNLDTATAASIRSIFASCADAGKTVIIVTHENTEAADYDRILTLADGQLVNDKRGK